MDHQTSLLRFDKRLPEGRRRANSSTIKLNGSIDDLAEISTIGDSTVFYKILITSPSILLNLSHLR